MEKESDCVFCKIASKKIESKFIGESDNFFSVSDIHPVTEGHCLIIPRNHYKTLLDIPSVLGSELLSFQKEMALKLMKEDKAVEGFNILANNFSVAGQLVPHAHIHLIPRRKNDGLRFFAKD